MTDKSDRQDGGGLSLREHCVRWLRRKRVTAELSTADLKIKAKEFERNIGANAEQMLSDAAQPGEIDGYPHSAIAGAVPSPTRDGAEGVGARDWINCPICDEPDMRCETFEEGMTLIHCTNHACPSNKRTAAPPKHAPDAMAARKACSDWAFHKEGEAIGYMLPQQAAREAFFAGAKWWAALSAALAPSPDGAGVVVDQILHQFENDDRTMYPDYEVILAIEKIRSALLSPSPAVAAEPDEWQRKGVLGKWITLQDATPERLAEWRRQGHELRPLYATPPVRGDREAALRLLQASSCFRGEVCVSLPCACAESLADLSLPVQPGAGEREAAPPGQFPNPSYPPEGYATGCAVDWALSRWNAEVANRPLINVHRRSLDTTWRQVIRHFGGDDIALCGPPHDELQKPKPEGER